MESGLGRFRFGIENRTEGKEEWGKEIGIRTNWGEFIAEIAEKAIGV